MVGAEIIVTVADGVELAMELPSSGSAPPEQPARACW